MAIFTFNNAKFRMDVSSGSTLTDYSTYVASVTLNHSGVELDNTRMGDTYQARRSGLKDWSIVLSMDQDFASGKIDAALNGMIGSNNTRSVELRPVNTDRGSTNPEYSGEVLLFDYAAMDGAVGDQAMVNITLTGSGTLTRTSTGT